MSNLDDSMKNIGIALLLIVISATGCTSAGENADDGTEASLFADATFRPLGNFDVQGSGSYKGHHPAAVSARLDLLDSVMDRVDDIRAALKSARSWYAKQQRVIEIMTAPDVSEAEAWFVDQIGSSIMLERLTRPVRPGLTSLAEKRVAVHFIGVLVARSSPNAPLIADALELTWDLWAPEKARAIAMTAAQDADEYLETCTACADSDSKSSAVVRNGESRLIAEGRVRLLQLAKTGRPG